MKDLKWFEQKWFVNLKIRTRYNLCFLLVAVIGVASGAAGVMYALSSQGPKAQLFVIIIAAVCLLDIILAVLLANINAFLVVDPMTKNDHVIERYSRGNFDTSDIIRKRDWVTVTFKDEIGVFSGRLKALMQYLKGLDKTIREVSDGDLTVDVPVVSPQDQIGNGLSTLVNNFHNLVASISTAIDQVASGANLVSNSSFSLSEGATHQASSVQQLTASLEEISEQTLLNAQNAEKANALAQNAKTNAAEGNSEMRDMLKAMEDISVSSSNINKIIKVIDDIAFQTNILALNAAVEAARAGQHGKGFAVVAEEVRNLAAKSANAARETTDLIENSIKKVEAGTKIANVTAKALDEIVVNVDRAAELIQSIATASAEQAQGIEQVNLGITQVSQVIQSNAATAQESASASEQLSSQAEQLKEQVSTFKLKGRSQAIPVTKPKVSAEQTVRKAVSAPSKLTLSSGEYGKY